MATNLVSEFEQEFELDLAPAKSTTEDEYSYETDDEFEMTEEAELDEEFETDEELTEDELDEEFETGEDFEADEEFEQDEELELFNETDYATFSRDGVYDRDQEFEQRIYNAMVNHRDNELGLDMELDAVLHEMERDYFFGAAKKWLKKKGLTALKNFAKNKLPVSGALKALSSLGRGKIRSLLKNKFLQAAAGFIPVAGPLVSKAMDVAGSLSGAAESAKNKIQNAIQVGKDAYEDLAESIPEAQNEFEVQRNARNAFRKALVKNPPVKHSHGGRIKQTISIGQQASVTVYPTKVSVNKGEKIIPLVQGSVVSVKPGKITIWKKR